MTFSTTDGHRILAFKHSLGSTGDANSAYAYTYDDIGRTLTVSNSGTSGVPTVVLTSAFDAASNRTKLTSTIGGTADFENDYSYDNLLRLTRLDQIGQSGGNTVADKRVDFVYDVGSRLTSLARQYKSGGTWTEAATTAFSYDTIDRLTGIDHKRGGTSLFTAYSYSFDYANRITGITSQDGTVTYTNDATNQLTGADYSYQTDETFSFDANGNWNMSGYTNGTNNKRSSDGTYNYTYDKEGNLILRVKISDSSRTEYTWDLRNRLTNITERATLGGAATKSIDYIYDVFDRRISKSVDADGAGAGAAVVTQFVYDGSSDAQVILQFGGSNNLTHRDLWAENIDQILADENSSNAILWSLNDNLGTVRDLIDNSGTVQNHLKYGAFHNVTSETNAAIDFLMGAAGMVRDEETGAHYAWHRYTQNGRWWSEDPIGFNGKDPNLQRVMGNGPIDSIDPSGLVEVLANVWNNIALPTLQGVAMAPVEALKYGNVFGQAYMLYNNEHPAQIWYQQIENHGFIAGTTYHSGNTLYTLAEPTTPFQLTVGNYIRYQGVFPDSQQDVENAQGQQYRFGVAGGTTLLMAGVGEAVVRVPPQLRPTYNLGGMGEVQGAINVQPPGAPLPPPPRLIAPSDNLPLSMGSGNVIVNNSPIAPNGGLPSLGPPYQPGQIVSIASGGGRILINQGSSQPGVPTLGQNAVISNAPPGSRITISANPPYNTSVEIATPQQTSFSVLPFMPINIGPNNERTPK